MTFPAKQSHKKGNLIDVGVFSLFRRCGKETRREVAQYNVKIKIGRRLYVENVRQAFAPGSKLFISIAKGFDSSRSVVEW